MVRSPLTKLVKIAWLLLVLMLLFAVPASAAFTFRFSSDGLRDLSDESWGLDNVSVSIAERIQNPDNGHWYQRFDNTMTWHDAKDYCESIGGYLATITLQAENDFVYNNLGSASPHEMVWLGAADEAQEGAWEWATSEVWEYTKWAGGEPNNCNGIEHYLVYFTPHDPLGRAGYWNDLGTGNNGGCGCDGCTNEWYPMSTICEWDRGVVFNPTNGHYYELVEVYGPGVNWSEARDAAAAMVYNGMPGHLATVTSVQEENFLVSNFPEIYPEYVWLGASDEASEGDWQWITGEAWNYTDWADGEPNGGAFENCLDFGDFSAQWNDESCDRPLHFYLVEYSPEESTTIAVDIKPGSDPNSINCNNENGVIAVAILTTEVFDATTVDHTTVTFEGASEIHVDKKGGEPRRHEEDVDGDGDTDLVFHFRLGDTDLTCGSTEGTLTGETFDGQAIEGIDAVRMID